MVIIFDKASCGERELRTILERDFCVFRFYSLCSMFSVLYFLFFYFTTQIRKMSKKAKSEKRRETVTFPSLFRMSTFVDCFRHLSIDAEFRFEFLKLPKYRDISL